jgi:tRNA (guanosine-2'-O-)-methyltransferase
MPKVTQAIPPSPPSTGLPPASTGLPAVSTGPIPAAASGALPPVLAPLHPLAGESGISPRRCTPRGVDRGLNPDEQAVFAYLSDFLTPRRRERFASVLSQRTRRPTVVLENIYQDHNISAVLRTCDAFGLQDVAAIEKEFGFEVNRQIALGTDQWLTIRRFAGPSPTVDCLADLKRRGYRIVATSPRPGSVPIDQLPLDEPVALVIGNEMDGVSEESLALADHCVHLPMYGFVESFNLSVATALCLQSLVTRLRAQRDDWGLSPEEQEHLMLDWTRKSLVNPVLLESRFWQQRAADCIPRADAGPGAQTGP